MALDWQTLNIPLAAGLNQKADPRALQPPSLDRALDVQFDEIGGLQTRKPFAALGANIFGGGTISTARRIYQNGDELVLLDKDTVYSWNAQLSKWVSKGTHLAVEVVEKSRFDTTGDQLCCDRAELSGTVVFAWTDNGRVYVAAEDKSTGSVLMAPTGITDSVSSAVSERPRLVALTTKILLFYHNGTSGAPASLRVLAIDPATPATGLSTQASALASANFGQYYDVTKQPGADTAVFAARRATTTSYTVGTVTSALTVTASTKARVCDGPIAVSCEPTGASVQVVRANVDHIQGDLITISGLVDVYTAQAIGTGPLLGPNGATGQIAAAHRSTTDSGQYRCYVFWSGSIGGVSIGVPVDGTQYNWVDTGNTLGTAAVFGSHATDDDLSVASRAFSHDGRVYVWLAFTGSSYAAGTSIALQNTYFLFRDDVFLTAKAVATVGGGASGAVGHLPGVAQTGTSGNETTFAFCGNERRAINLGGGVDKGYGARGPRDVRFTFDTNRARRAARIGQTLYIACGEGLLAYDGTRVVEAGFHVYPWAYAISGDPGTGNVPDGTYAGKHTWRWDNARGERDRSTTATVDTAVMVGGPGHIVAALDTITATHKAITGNMPASECWRTVVAPIADSPFYRTTNVDPSVTSGDNEYLACTDTSTTDALVDASLIVGETNPENGAVLEYLAPVPCTMVIASDARLFIAGVAGDPDRVRYSRLRGPNEVASFHDALTIDIPPSGGDITALAFLNETLIVFRESAIYACAGDGYDNTGGGQNYGPARQLSVDVGAVNHESVALTPQGLVFKSSKGWYLLNRGWAVEYIGAPVSDYDSDTVVAVHVVEAQHQVRCLTTARMLVFDYLVGQWAEWTIADGLHAASWNGTYYYLAAAGPKAEQTSYSSLTYGWDVETGWLKLNDLQGFGACRWFQLLGEYRSTHVLRIRVARDYEYDGSGSPRYFQDKSWTPSPVVVGSALKLQHSPSRPITSALKIRVTAYATLTTATFNTTTGLTVGGAVALTGGPASLQTWDATLTSRVLGTDGNSVTISIYTSVGDAGIEIRDHQAFDGATWSTDYNNVGIRIGSGSWTVTDLEAAINDQSRLVSVTSADSSHASPYVISDTNTLHTGTFTGGAQTYPTGEAAKLTGLGLEIGMRRGLAKRIASAQTQ